MRDPSIERAFWSALARGDTARLRELVAKGADVNQPIDHSGGETPLIRAVAAGDVGLIRLLLELGADVNLPCAEGKAWTPLMFAHDSPEVLRELLSAGATVNARSGPDWTRGPLGGMAMRPGGETALHLAAAVGNADSVSLLLQAGAEVEARAGDGSAPLDCAIRQGTVTRAAEALVEAGAELTPQRLERMHAAAHRPDSDVLTFSPTAAGSGNSPADKPGSRSSRAALPGPAPDIDNPPQELRCPSCHALIYSRKSKLCGQCGALLPRDLILTEEQAAALHEARRWARDLADKFDGLSPSLRVPGSPRSGRRVMSGASEEAVSPEQLVRQVSCVEEFKRRNRPAFWLYVTGYGFTVGVCVLIAVPLHVMTPALLVLVIAMFVVPCVMAWYRASPICPNCRQNIRYCAASFCHVCGASMTHGRCGECGVDESWRARFFRRRGLGGNYQWIKFCPGCGVGVGSKVLRWLAN